MAVDQQNAQSRLSALQGRANRLFSEVALAEVSRDVNDVSNDVVKLQKELDRARLRGYSFADYLEHKVKLLTALWITLRREVEMLIEHEVHTLRADQRQVETLLMSARHHAGNTVTLVEMLPALEREIDDLDRKIRQAETRVKEHFSKLEREVCQTVEQIQGIHWGLDQQDEATFSFLKGENLFLAAAAEWVETGKGRQNPDGILYLTDRRLIFEQKEQTGKTLGLFGGKRTQELEWTIEIEQIEAVETEKKGLFGGKDMLHLKLDSGAPFSVITIELKGKAKNTYWAAQLRRMIYGDPSDERAIAPEPDLIQAIGNGSNAICAVCGATLPKLTVGEQQLHCNYCNTLIRLDGQTLVPQDLSDRNKNKAVVLSNADVYPAPDDATVIGRLNEGSIVRLGKNFVRGNAYYMLIKGEGPVKGWVGSHVLKQQS